MNEQQHLDGPEQAGSASTSDVSIDAQLVAQGARFSQARETKGLSIGEVSSRMKVSPGKLRALEAGDISGLSDTAAFAVATVRGYAKILGVDATQFISLLHHAYGQTPRDLSMPASARTHLPGGSRNLPRFQRGAQKKHASWMWYTSAVIIAAIAVGIWRANQHDASRGLSQLQAVAASGARVVGHSNAPAASATAAQAASVSGASSASAVAAHASAVTVASAASASVNKPASAPAVIATQAPASALPASGAAAAGTATLVVHATQDTWLSVRQKGGKQIFSSMVHGGSTQQVNGLAPLKITFGDVRGIGSVTLNGQPVAASKYAAPRGDVVSRVILP